jgi:hypothetical protein
MGKNKKKKDRKKVKDAVPDDVLDAAAVSIRKFRKVTHELSKLSTGQKLLGSLVLVAAGLIYLDQRKDEDGNNPGQDARRDWPRLPEAEATSATVEPNESPRPVKTAPGKRQKTTKATKPHGNRKEERKR